MNNNFLDLLKKTPYNGILIPVTYFILIIIISNQHHLFADWDGAMHYFSGVDIYQGNGYRGWASHFWPPLYPVLTGLLAKLLAGFEAAKMVSMIAASLLLFVIYKFVYKLSGNSIAACLAQLLVATNYTFVLLSIQAENHMLDALFYVWAILLLLQCLEKGNNYSCFLTGIVCGLAGLSRYTSYALIPAFVLTLFFFYPFRRALSYASSVILGFMLISSPWWIVNYLNNGSPFSTWQYMNIGAGVFTTSENKWQWWWSGINSFNSVFDILTHAPLAYTGNFLKNVLKSIALIIYNGQVAGFLCSMVVILFIGYHYAKSRVLLLRTKTFLPLLINLVCFLALVSQAFVFGDVFLSWLVLIVVYGTFAFYKLSTTIHPFKPAYSVVILAVVVLVTGFDLSSTTKKFKSYMSSTRGMEDNLQIVTALKSYDNNISKRMIMSFHPGRAYHLGSRYIMLPLYYEGDLNGLVTYSNMSHKVKDHAPRFPSTINVNNLKADYLVYDQKATAYLPQFSFLLEKGNSRIPQNFQLIYLSGKAAVYKIN